MRWKGTRHHFRRNSEARQSKRGDPVTSAAQPDLRNSVDKVGSGVCRPCHALTELDDQSTVFIDGVKMWMAVTRPCLSSVCSMKTCEQLGAQGRRDVHGVHLVLHVPPQSFGEVHCLCERPLRCDFCGWRTCHPRRAPSRVADTPKTQLHDNKTGKRAAWSQRHLRRCRV